MLYNDTQLESLVPGDRYDFTVATPDGEREYKNALFAGLGEYHGPVDGRRVHFIGTYLQDEPDKYGMELWDVARVTRISKPR